MEEVNITGCSSPSIPLTKNKEEQQDNPCFDSVSYCPPEFRRSSNSLNAVRISMANPNPSISFPTIFSLLMPTTFPSAVTSGPPLFPGLICALV